MVKIGTRVFDVWESASIPSINLRSIENKIDYLIDRYVALKKSYINTNKSDNFRHKLSNFESCRNQLLDTAVCKCHMFESCKFCKDKKVPKVERTFLNDQHGPRRMIIGGTDPKITGRLVKKIARKTRDKLNAVPDLQLEKDKNFKQNIWNQYNFCDNLPDAPPIASERNVRSILLFGRQRNLA